MGSFTDLIPKAPTKTEVIAGAGKFTDLIPQVDEESGAPMHIRVLAGAVDKPEDKLATVKKFYPDAAFRGPASLDSSIVFTNPATGKLTAVNPKGFDVGDLYSIVREGAQAVGATAGGIVGAPGGPAGVMAGAGLGMAGAEEAFNGLARIIGVQDTRSIKERFGDSGVNFVLGSMSGPVGSGAAAGVRGGVRRVFRGATGQTEAAKAIDDLSRFGASPSVAQATQAGWLDGVESSFSKYPGGAGRFRNVVKQTTDQISDSLSKKLVRFSGRKDIDPEVAGRAVVQGTEDFVSRFKSQANALYNRVDTLIAPDAAVPAMNTKAVLQSLSNPVPGSAETSKLFAAEFVQKFNRAITSDFPNGQIPYAVLQRMRSMVGEKLATLDFVGNIPKGELKQLYAALSQDLRDGARVAGGEKAVGAFDRASTFYRAGIKRIDEVLEPLVKGRAGGTKEAERVFDALRTGGNRGGTQIRTVMRSLDTDQKKALVSAVMKDLATPPPGAHANFSFPSFLANWNRLDRRAKDALLGSSGMRELGRDLDALVRASQRVVESSRAFANPSGTASATAGQTMIFGSMGAFGLAPFVGIKQAMMFPAIVAISSAGANVGARLMTSPNFVRWLARATQIEANGMGAHIARLSAVAANSDPDTAQAIKEFAENLGSLAEMATPEKAGMASPKKRAPMTERARRAANQ